MAEGLSAQRSHSSMQMYDLTLVKLSNLVLTVLVRCPTKSRRDFGRWGYAPTGRSPELRQERVNG